MTECVLYNQVTSTGVWVIDDQLYTKTLYEILELRIQHNSAQRSFFDIHARIQQLIRGSGLGNLQINSVLGRSPNGEYQCNVTYQFTYQTRSQEVWLNTEMLVQLGKPFLMNRYR